MLKSKTLIFIFFLLLGTNLYAQEELDDAYHCTFLLTVYDSKNYDEIFQDSKTIITGVVNGKSLGMVKFEHTFEDTVLHLGVGVEKHVRSTGARFYRFNQPGIDAIAVDTNSFRTPVDQFPARFSLTLKPVNFTNNVFFSTLQVNCSIL